MEYFEDILLQCFLYDELEKLRRIFCDKAIIYLKRKINTGLIVESALYNELKDNFIIDKIITKLAFYSKTTGLGFSPTCRKSIVHCSTRPEGDPQHYGSVLILFTILEVLGDKVFNVGQYRSNKGKVKNALNKVSIGCSPRTKMIAAMIIKILKQNNFLDKIVPPLIISLRNLNKVRKKSPKPSLKNSLRGLLYYMMKRPRKRKVKLLARLSLY